MKLDDILNILYSKVIININHILKLCDMYTCQNNTYMKFFWYQRLEPTTVNQHPLADSPLNGHCYSIVDEL
jgi:hypothetical protein